MDEPPFMGDECEKVLVAEFSLSLRVKMTLGVGNFLGLFLKLYHNAMPSKGGGDTYL
jgi:hypothetical protein